MSSKASGNVPIRLPLATPRRARSIPHRESCVVSLVRPGWSGIPLKDFIIYEFHTGTFTREGTFEGVIPRLPYIRDLGITAIEFMPVAEVPGNRNWGYDGASLYAPQSSYGGPRA